MRTGLIAMAAVTGLAKARVELAEPEALTFDTSGDPTLTLGAGQVYWADEWCPPLPTTLKDGPVFFQTRYTTPPPPTPIRDMDCGWMHSTGVIEQRRWHAVVTSDPRHIYDSFYWELIDG